MSNKIKAAIRIRPFLRSELKNCYVNNSLKVNSGKKEVEVLEGGSKRCFNFDYVFDESSGQENVYDECNIDSMIDKALKGYHSTIFAYGQTGSGKTYTMHGEENIQDTASLNIGIIPKLVHNMYKMIQMQKDRTFIISVSFLQIYNEKIYDLLNPSSPFNNKNMISTQNGLRLRWNKEEQFSVENLFIFECKTQEELLKYFVGGLKNRINASHKLNVQSSRSHSILSIRIESFDNFNQSNILSSRIELVDLAGSERIGMTGTEGKLAKESIDINKSLFTLRQVITILADASKNRSNNREKVYVPYRDSKLTSILKQSIGGNSYSLMIACINPNDMFLEENISTLTYATKASYITNQPTVNDDPRTKIINQLKKQVKGLTEELNKANQHIQFIASMQHAEQEQHQRKNEMMPEPVHQLNLKKTVSDKNQHQSGEQFSERLVESINMVRELLKSNKQLRQKLQIVNRRADQKDLEIYQLTKENQSLKESFQKQGEDTPIIGNPYLSSNIRNSTSMKSKRHSHSQNPTQMVELVGEQPSKLANNNGHIYGFNSANSKNNFNYWNSVEINQYYMNERGVDSVPTNFSRKEVNTAQEKRIINSRHSTNDKGPARHAITAKISNRNWKNIPQNPNKFLSFYNETNPTGFY